MRYSGPRRLSAAPPPPIGPASARGTTRLLLVALAVLLMAAAPADRRVQQPPPVRAIGPMRVTVSPGAGQIPLFANRDWTQPQPDITRAVIVLHGLHRDAGPYLRGAERAAAAGGTAGEHVLLLAPQFLADEDVEAHGLGPEMLHWGWNDWSGGQPAHGPVPASPFDAFDAILARLADRRLFPALADVVLAGHSAGGQVVQRYAVVGAGAAAFAAEGGRLHFIVANPSSYLYFSAERPVAGFQAAGCPRFNDWKYGFAAGVPPYVTGTPAALERRFASRDVTLLLGGADSDPELPVLDRSCAAEAQGSDHLSRGLAYGRSIAARDPDARLRVAVVPGVAHQGARMWRSPCGLDALFAVPGCAVLDIP